MGFPGGSVVKNLPVNARATGNADWIPMLGRSPGGGHGRSSILTWRIPWTEEPGRLKSMGWQRVRHNLVTEQHHHIDMY